MDEATLDRWSEEFLRRYQVEKPVALLLGREPEEDLGYRYVRQGEHEAVVIGSLDAAQLLYFDQPPVYRALLRGLPVYLVESGLEHRRYAGCANRLLWNRLVAAERQLKQLGVEFVGGQERRLITAQAARQLQKRGQTPPPGSRMTPLARDILEGKG